MTRWLQWSYEKQIEPNTALFPAPVVAVSCQDNQFEYLITVNRLASIHWECPVPTSHPDKFLGQIKCPKELRMRG
jgi:hypothetical protein